MRKLLLIASLALLPSIPNAQCNLSFTSYGSGCTSVFAQVPVLSGAFDPASCNATITLGGFPGCCNTFLTTRIFVFGVNPASVPVPQIGPGCELLVQRIVHLPVPGSQDSISFTAPSGFPPFTLYMQGINVYFTTIGMTTNLELSQGLQLDFS